MLLLLLAVASCRGSIVSTTYSRVTIETSDTKLDGVLYVSTLDENPLDSHGSPISALSLSVPVSQGPQVRGTELPPAVTEQFGSLRLECPNIVYPSSQSNEQQNGPPSFFIPLPAVRESASVLFQILGSALDPTTVVPMNNTLIGSRFPAITTMNRTRGFHSLLWVWI